MVFVKFLKAHDTFMRSLPLSLLLLQRILRPQNSVYLVKNSFSVCVSNSLFKSVAVSTMKEKKPFERLPTSVLPKNYKLTLTPNLTEFTFAGEEVIDVEVRKSWLNLFNNDSRSCSPSGNCDRSFINAGVSVLHLM